MTVNYNFLRFICAEEVNRGKKNLRYPTVYIIKIPLDSHEIPINLIFNSFQF